MTDVVVKIRCSARGCRRSLLAVHEWPESSSPLWSALGQGVWCEACPKHREIRPNEVISAADARRDRKGLPPLDRASLMVFVSWRELRPFYLDAAARGRDVDVLKP